MLALLLLASRTQAQPGLYLPERGDHELQVVEEYTLHTPQRDIPLRLTFPRDGRDYPVLLWLHGALGSKDNYLALVEHWASHGYVVIQPTFGDSATYLDEDQRRELGSVKAAVNSKHVMQQWDRRPREVSAIIDRLDELAQQVPGLAGKFDKSRLAVGGHSYGAHTSMLIGGVEAQVRRQALSFYDSRVKVVLLVSPTGSTPLIRTAGMARLRTPALVVTGDHDGSPVRGQEGKAGQWRREVFDHAPPGDVYLLWIQDAYHDFGGIAGGRRAVGAAADPLQVRMVSSTCLAMLDAYLKQVEQAQRYLRGEALQQGTGGKGALSAR